MANKRKRPSRSSKPLKKAKAAQEDDGRHESLQNGHPILKHYFETVVTLREYFVTELNATQSDAAKTIAQLGSRPDVECTRRQKAGNLLDTVIVGFNNRAQRSRLKERHTQDLTAFTQQLPGSTLGSNADPGASLQLEVVDFVIWLLFRRKPPPTKPQHLLCQGFERSSGPAHHGLNPAVVASIPGIVCHYPNNHVDTVTNATWCNLLALLGKGGDLIMTELLVDCCLFLPTLSGAKSLRQLSGVPLSTLPTRPMQLSPIQAGLVDRSFNIAERTVTHNGQPFIRKPSEIKFVRNRMFYAKASVNSNGNVRLGMRHIHVLNRHSDLNSSMHTVHIMKYMFPRQFRLHNVFTCVIDHRETALPFKDYTLREAEIRLQENRATSKNPEVMIGDRTSHPILPKRLRGPPFDLVQAFRKLHHRCSYIELLRYYCPVDTESVLVEEYRNPNFSAMELATPHSHVSAFCQAVVKKVVPKDFWGTDELGHENECIVLKQIDRFIRARKFESLTLDEVLLGLKITAIPWLCLGQRKDGKMSISDFNKRKELLAEFVYYVFDSFLIPLIRSNFYVTESNVHRNRLFFFRHDIWRALSEPAMAEFKADLFDELDAEKARTRLASRPFGFSNVRLLPKAKGFRPITNLRRRPYIWQNGRRVLGRSINSAMNPAFRVLNYEKSTHLDELGCSLFSVGDVYPKLKEYIARLDLGGFGGKPLFFAKVDVQACFDTVPQQHLIQVITVLLSSEEYRIENHAEVKPPQITAPRDGAMNSKAVVKYTARAHPTHHLKGSNADCLDDCGNMVKIGPLVQQSHRKGKILELLREHVEYNIVKIGKKYYRQKNGIPQGSVLSSLLCNFFYGKLEQDILRFVNRSDTALLRLIDDFLLITTERTIAEAFLHTMHQGIPEYGIAVKPEKSLVNFDCAVGENRVPRAEGSSFPYCGLIIDTSSLNIKKQSSLKADTSVSDSLTIEYASLPGRTFRRKALNALKIQLHGMFFDTSLNSLETVISNLYKAFNDAAMRCFYYIKGLSHDGKPSFETLKNTIEDLIRLGFTMINKKRTRRKEVWKSYECSVRRNQMQWLACKAFNDVFQRKQTKHQPLLDWLRRTMAAAWPSSRVEASALQRLVKVRSQ